MTPSSSPPVPTDPTCAVCSKPIQSGYIQTQMGEVVHIRCRSEEDQARLTRAWAMRCAACHHPLGATDAKFIVGYVPAGETLFASVRLSGMALPLCTYSFDVAQESEVVASGTLSTWLTATGA